MSAIARILDANANRAREALRVMEDAARFALNDEALSAQLKSLRHDLRAAIDSLPAGWLQANRDTPGDVGTVITNEAELSRADLREIVVAAGKRSTEALRAIEEASKTIDADLARSIESLRYRAYDLDQRLSLRFGSSRARQWRLCLLLTKALCHRPWREALEQSISGGVDCVQVREKEMDGGELASHAREVIAIARRLNLSVVINDRVDVALATGADGVHLGQSDLSVGDARRLAGQTLIVGVSTHDLNEADRAVREGADYCGVGAMFPSSTKQRATSGIAYLKQFVARFPNVPHLAIGGITPQNAAEAFEAGAKGVAVSSAICASENPGEAAGAIVRAIAGGASRPAAPMPAH